MRSLPLRARMTSPAKDHAPTRANYVKHKSMTRKIQSSWLVCLILRRTGIDPVLPVSTPRTARKRKQAGRPQSSHAQAGPPSGFRADVFEAPTVQAGAQIWRPTAVRAFFDGPEE